jgi:colanic acid/amylovoran biosynthesis glycosyltransferase
MNIAVFVSRFPKLSETFILNQLTGLLDAGHHVDIYATSRGDTDTTHPEVERYRLMERTRFLNTPPSRFGRLVKALTTLVTYRRYPHLNIRHALIPPGRRSVSLLARCAAFKEAPVYDVLLCQYGYLGLATLGLVHLGAVQGDLVVAFRGHDMRALRTKPPAYRALFREAKLVLPVCHAFKQRLVNAGCEPHKLHVHHSGIDLSQFAYHPRARAEQEPTTILTIARLVEKKGVEYGIRAAAALKASGRAFRYAIVGDGPLRTKLQRLIDELGLSQEVVLLGWKTNAEVRRLLSEAHVLIAPSITTSAGDIEGIPNVMKEAMATGMPVIGTLHSGIPELVEDGVCGFLVPERDSEALADRLAALIDHPDLWPRMGLAGRKRIEREYDAASLNRQLIGLFEALRAPSQPPARAMIPARLR